MEENINQALPDQPVQPPPEQTKKSFFSNKVILIILGAIILLSSTAFASYSFLGSKGIFKKACTQEVKICPDGSSVGRTEPNCEFSTCPKTSPSPTPDPTANWKTYENKRLKINFKYPSTWEGIKESGVLCENTQTGESYECQGGLRMLSTKGYIGSFLVAFIPSNESSFGRGGFWGDFSHQVDSEEYIKTYCQNSKRTSNCITYTNKNGILVAKSYEDIGWGRSATVYYIKAKAPEYKGIVLSAVDIQGVQNADTIVESIVNELKFIE